MRTGLSDLAVNLHAIAARCHDAPSADSISLVQELRDRLMTLPEPERFGLNRNISDVVFKARLDADSPLDACLMLINSNVGYMLSRSSDAAHAATVYFPASENEQTMTGASNALAFVGALALALYSELEAC